LSDVDTLISQSPTSSWPILCLPQYPRRQDFSRLQQHHVPVTMWLRSLPPPSLASVAINITWLLTAHAISPRITRTSAAVNTLHHLTLIGNSQTLDCFPTFLHSIVLSFSLSVIHGVQRCSDLSLISLRLRNYARRECRRVRRVARLVLPVTYY